MILRFLVFQTATLFALSYANTTNNNEFDYIKSKEYQREVEIQKNMTANWTTCEEFLENTTFDINSVLDIDWQIYYFWNYGDDESYNIRFSLASPILVDRFKVELKDLDYKINWTRAALFMETSIDFSALYISTETSGKFRLIPSFVFKMEYIPMMMFGMKLVEPGYLGIANCQQKLCYALAPADKMPQKEDIHLAAEKIGFRGDHNYSYLIDYGTFPTEAPRDYHNEDDAEEDEEFEIQSEIDEL